jgi:hypothetical protein
MVARLFVIALRAGALMSGKYPIDPAKFTIVLTSCGRFDLLEDTIASFASHFDVQKIIVAEDSGDQIGAAELASKFSFVDMRVNDPKCGQMGSIDGVYQEITTPYIVHLEDDWRFERSCDLEAITTALEKHPDLSGICIANREYAPKYEPFAKSRAMEGMNFKVFDLDAHPEWFSYSFNPSVARTGLWKKFGPFAKYKTEAELSRTLKRLGMRVALLSPGIAEHTGDERHVPDPYQPVRAKTFSAKLARSIRKRYRRLRGLIGR